MSLLVHKYFNKIRPRSYFLVYFPRRFSYIQNILVQSRLVLFYLPMKFNIMEETLLILGLLLYTWNYWQKLSENKLCYRYQQVMLNVLLKNSFWITKSNFLSLILIHYQIAESRLLFYTSLLYHIYARQSSQLKC